MIDRRLDETRSCRRRRKVIEVHNSIGTPRMSVAHLSCGHVVFRMYHVSVGATAYCPLDRQPRAKVESEGRRG